MEKLLELLKEYDGIRSKNANQKFERRLTLNMIDLPNRTFWESEVIVISYKYGFIKRLIKEDLIDTFRLLQEWFDTQKWYEREHYHTVSEWNTDLLLMLLNIQEEPVSFLITLLK